MVVYYEALNVLPLGTHHGGAASLIMASPATTDLTSSRSYPPWNMPGRTVLSPYITTVFISWVGTFLFGP